MGAVDPPPVTPGTPMHANESSSHRYPQWTAPAAQMGTGMGTVGPAMESQTAQSRCTATPFEWVAGGSNPEPTD